MNEMLQMPLSSPVPHSQEARLHQIRPAQIEHQVLLVSHNYTDDRLAYSTQ